MRYFAYGSNMDFAQMTERCPRAEFVSIARLSNHRLAFTRESVRRNCGVADAVPEKDQAVWGVVYNLTDFVRLDAAEGYKPGRVVNSYARRRCAVFFDGDPTLRRLASTYFATTQPSPPLPSRAYLDLILSGARNWGLPDGYVRMLERIEVRA